MPDETNANKVESQPQETVAGVPVERAGPSPEEVQQLKAQLEQARKEAEELRGKTAKLDELGNLEQDLKIAYDDDADPVKREDAMVRLTMRAMGVSKEEAVKLVNGGGQDDGQGEPSDSELQKRLARIEQEAESNKTEELRIHRDTLVENFIQNDKTVQAYMKLKEEDEKGPFADFVKKQVISLSKEKLADAVRRQGKTLDRGLVGDIIGKSTSEVLASLKSVIGDPAKLGRSRASGPESEYEELLGAQPVKEPGPGASEEEIHSWLADSFTRLDAEEKLRAIRGSSV